MSRRVGVLAAALAAAVVLSACGSSPKHSSTTTTTTSSTMATTTTSTSMATTTTSSTMATTTTSTAPGGTTDQSLEAQVEAVQGKAFTATWQDHSGSTTTDVTYAQEPPSSAYFASSGEETIATSSGTYTCSSATKTCLKLPAEPLAEIGVLFNGTEFLDAAKAWESAAALAAAGVTVTYGNSTYGGLASSCITATHAGSSATWCVATSSGVLTYWSAGSDWFEITSYSSSPPSSDFSEPSGYTTTSS